MADTVTITGGKSPAEVAYTLLIAVAEAEGKWTGTRFMDADRQYILDTYAECIKASRGARRLGRGDAD